MSTRRVFIAATLILVPISLQAQRGKGSAGVSAATAAGASESNGCGTASGGFGKIGGGGSSKEADCIQRNTKGAASMSKELQEQNPIALLLDRKKDIKLTDDEQKSLKSINDMLKDSTKAYFKTLDSAQKEMKNGGSDMPAGQRLILRSLLEQTSDSVNARYDAALKEAMTKIAADRQQAATDALQKAKQEIADKKKG
jgi:hypothetical protein